MPSSRILKGEETVWQRTKRKVTENPFVLPALGLTFWGLYDMFKTLYRNDKMGFQKSQRYRIAAQLLTFATVFGGILYQDYNNQSRNSSNESDAASN